MSIFMELVDFDDEFSRLSQPPVIINDLSIASEQEKATLRNLIMTQYQGDVMDIVPRCDCTGDTGLVGAYFLGKKCKNCGHTVKSPTDSELQPIMWVRCPKGVKALMNPYVWGLLSQTFKRSGFNIIQWLCDSSYVCKNRIPPEINFFVNANWQRSYNNFVENFDQVIASLFSLRSFRKHAKRDDIQRFLAENRNKIFSQWLPLLNKSIHVIELTDVGRYSEQHIFEAMNAILMVVSIDRPEANNSLRVKENRTAKMLTEQAEFNNLYYRNSFSKKPGLIRKHLLGARSHWSFRAVITSITGPHRYDELHVPWGVAIGTLQLHLVNKLKKLGYGHDDCTAFVAAHAQKYHPLLDRLFQELINESSGGKGIPCTLCRNPSLSRGSIQRLLISHVKKDPNDPTISLSILIVRAYNADFDGDALSGALILDEALDRAMHSLSPHKSAFDSNKPRSVSDNLAMPKTVVATISAWMKAKETYHDQSRMVEFLA